VASTTAGPENFEASAFAFVTKCSTTRSPSFGAKNGVFHIDVDALMHAVILESESSPNRAIARAPIVVFVSPKCLCRMRPSFVRSNIDPTLQALERDQALLSRATPPFATD
jgi:hypothetical protein